MTDYYSDFNYVSQSMLKVFIDSPEMYRRRFVLKPGHPDYMDSETTSPEMLLGSLTHAVFLEQSLDEFHVVDTTSRQTTAWKAEVENAKEWGRKPILKKDLETANRITQSIRNNPHIKAYLDAIPDESNEERELEHRWQGQFLPKKARFDQVIVWAEKETIIVLVLELKTTADPAIESFIRKYFDFGYHVQAAWYEEGIHDYLKGKNVQFRHAVIAVRNKEPFDAAIYKVDPSFVAIGRTAIDRAEPLLARCIQSNDWTLNNVQLSNIIMPNQWMLKQ